MCVGGGYLINKDGSREKCGLDFAHNYSVYILLGIYTDDKQTMPTRRIHFNYYTGEPQHKHVRCRGIHGKHEECTNEKVGQSFHYLYLHERFK